MTNDGELYVATDIGMFKSIDYGKSWHIINEGLNINNHAPYITKIIIDDNPKYDRTIIYALVGEYASKIFESYDKGMNWFEHLSPEGFVIDIDVAQGYNGNSNIYALSYNNEKENDDSDYKEVFYLNHFIKKVMIGLPSAEFVEHYLKTGSMVEAHWESKQINIDTKNGKPKKIIINDWNYPYLLTEYPYNLYRSQDDGNTWAKIIFDNDLSSGFINIYSTFSDSLPAEGEGYAFSVLVQNIFNYPDNTITLYDFTTPYGKILSVPNERINIQKIKIGESYLDTILYYPYIGDQEKMKNTEMYESLKNFHYYIPGSFQATYHLRYLNTTLFVASNEGVFSCSLQ